MFRVKDFDFPCDIVSFLIYFMRVIAFVVDISLFYALCMVHAVLNIEYV